MNEISPEGVAAIVTAATMGTAAVITAIAALVKSFVTSRDMKAVIAENESLKEENISLKIVIESLRLRIQDLEARLGMVPRNGGRTL